MSSFEARYDQIEAYLKGTLNEVERESFEAELAQNEALSEEVKIQKASRALIEQVYLQEMSAIIREQSIEKPFKTTRWKWLSGGLVLVGMLSFFLIDKEETANDVIERSNSVIDEKVINEESNEEANTIVIINEAQGNVIGDSMLNTTLVKIGKKDVDTALHLIKKEPLIVEETTPQEVVKGIEKVVEQVVSMAEPDCINPKLTPIRILDCHLYEADGELLLDESKDVQYSINKSEFNDYPESKGLEAGNYSVQIKDESGCIFSLGDYEIKQSACLKDKDIAFNSSYDGVLEVPIEELGRTEVVLMNRAGVQVFATELENSTYFEWDGKYTNGAEAAMGLHKLIITSRETKETCLYNVVIEK